MFGVAPRRLRRVGVLSVLALVAAMLGGSPASALGERVPQTRLVSATPSGAPAGNGADAASISADGRLVAFLSESADLVPGDTNGVADVFVRDLTTGITRRVSVASGGAQADGRSGPPALSGNGRFVAFPSEATNLVTGDTNVCFAFPVAGSCPDIFVHDLVSGTTARVSVNSVGVQTTGESLYAAISHDGRFVAFASLAPNLVPDDTNRDMDVFRHDTETGRTVRVSIGGDGQQADSFSFAPSVSADGGRVAFTSLASNLVSGDTNGVDDVFVRDVTASTTIRVSVGTDGGQSAGFSGGPSISAGGTLVAFWSEGALVPGDTNHHTDAYVHALANGRTTRVSVSTEGAQGNGPVTAPPSLSPDGRFVAFESEASNLVDGDDNGALDVFLTDLGARTTVLISVGRHGVPANGGSGFPWVSRNGCVVAFSSAASDLVPPRGTQPGERPQVYVRGPQC